MTSPKNGDTAKADLMRIALARDLEQIGRGDSNAMGRVYASTSPKLNALLIRMLGDSLEAEEVLQDVYLTVWRRGAVFDPARASPITWLVTIARNRAIDRIRANKAARRSAIVVSLDGQECPDTLPTALEEVEKAEDGRRLKTCLEALEARARLGIQAAFFEGLTYEELAKREGVPAGTMKSWIRRGLISLRKCMTDERDG
jgi:RNA polymerase sigma factor (sigma-70 family)